MSPHTRTPLVLGFVALSAVTGSHALAVTALRITDLDLRDPHIYMEFLGCRDITDVAVGGSSVNGDLQTDIESDGDMNGFLDLSLLIVFNPFDSSGPGGTLVYLPGICTAPMAGTSCTPESTTPLYLSYQNSAAGACLEPILGTTWGPYTPEIVSPTAPCFVSEEFAGVLPLFGGTPVTLQHVQIAATYGGAEDLVAGLIRGFLTEADANATILSPNLPVVGGKALSVLLPGGNPPGPDLNCAGHSDKDFVDGVPGWWFYYNFTAEVVPYASATGVGAPRVRGVSIDGAVPNPFNPSTTLRYSIDEDADVRVSIFDANGRFVADLVHQHQPAGVHEAAWNGTTASGATASSGVYFARLQSAGKTDTRKVVLLK